MAGIFLIFGEKGNRLLFSFTKFPLPVCDWHRAIQKGDVCAGVEDVRSEKLVLAEI